MNDFGLNGWLGLVLIATAVLIILSVKKSVKQQKYYRENAGIINKWRVIAMHGLKQETHGNASSTGSGEIYAKGPFLWYSHIISDGEILTKKVLMKNCSVLEEDREDAELQKYRSVTGSISWKFYVPIGTTAKHFECDFATANQKNSV